MFGFRKIAYMLLSRNFWLGLGFGFLLASVFAVSQASAFYKDSSIETYSSFCGVSGVNAKIFFQDTATSTLINTYRSGTQTGTDNCYALRRYTPDTLSIATTTIMTIEYTSVGTPCYMVAVRGTTRASYSVGQEWSLSATTTGKVTFQNTAYPYTGFSVGSRIKSGIQTICSIYIKDIYDNLGNDYYSIIDSEASGGNPEPLLLYIDSNSNMKIASTTCTSLDGSTDCIMNYDFTTDWTVENIFFLTILFLVAVFSGFWVVKTFW